MRTLNSKAMTRANQLRKEGYSLSEALKKAWAELKADKPTVVRVTVEASKEVEQMTLSEKVKEYKDLERYISILKEKLDDIKVSITSVMEDENINQLDIDGFTVRYQEIVSNRFDTKSFKKTYLDLYEQFLYESKCKRFTIAC